MAPSQERKASANGGNNRSRSRSRSRSPRRGKVTSRRVVIANIPYHITWSKLKQLFRDELGFSGYLRLMKSKGRPNGMGLMEFKSVEGAEKAIEKMHRYEIGDRRIVVREETLRDQERMANMEFDGPSNSDGPGPASGMMMSNSGPGMPPQDRGYVGSATPSVNNLTPTVLENMGVRGPITDSLYISNLDYAVDWRKIKDIFKIAGRVVHATVKQDDDGRSKGVAIVRFEHPYEALLAWAMFNGQNINDRPIRIKIDRDGGIAPANIPVFPLSPKGAAAADSFMAHFGKMSGSSPPGSQSLSYSGSGFMPQQQSQMGPSQGVGGAPGIASAVAALMSGNGGSRGMPVPLHHQELVGSLLGATSAGGFPQGPMNQSMGYGGPVDRSRDPASTVQQLMMAAAAGGMPQEQIAQAISALGLSRDGPGMSSYPGIGGMPTPPAGAGDPYGEVLAPCLPSCQF